MTNAQSGISKIISTTNALSVHPGVTLASEVARINAMTAKPAIPSSEHNVFTISQNASLAGTWTSIPWTRLGLVRIAQDGAKHVNRRTKH